MVDSVFHLQVCDRDGFCEPWDGGNDIEERKHSPQLLLEYLHFIGGYWTHLFSRGVPWACLVYRFTLDLFTSRGPTQPVRMDGTFDGWSSVDSAGA